jgi:enoyl-CoA hydratase
MEFNTIRFEAPEPGIGLITLNRPDRLNALSLDMVGELHALFTEVAGRKDLRVLVLTGEGRGFCSGADLKDARLRQEFPTSPPDATIHLVAIQKKYADLVLEMQHLPSPLSPQSRAAAGERECAWPWRRMGDYRPKGRFHPFPYRLSGGEMGTSFFLPQVGSSRAAEILLTGTVDAGGRRRSAW